MGKNFTLLAYRPGNKNKRWPFPTAHAFVGVQERSQCGKVSRNDTRYTFCEEIPEGTILVACEKCCYSDLKLREEIYGDV